MKRIFIFVLVLMAGAGLIVQCGGGGGGNGGPDLAGTWTGTGWSALEPLMVAENLASEPQVVFPACPTQDGFVTIDLVMESDGTPSDLTICGESIDAYFDTSVIGEVDQTNFGDNLMWLVFSDSEDDLFEGSVVLDESGDYIIIYFWEATEPWGDVFFGVLQKTETMLAFSELSMVGSWSGFTVDFWEEDYIYFDKSSPLNITLTQNNSLALTGTDPDGFSLAGTVTMDDTDFGYVEGTVDIVGEEVQFIMDYGFRSLDNEFFGALIYPEFMPLEWSIIAVRNQEILE